MVVEPRHLIAITPEVPVKDESLKIEALLDAGWYRVHLRHPNAPYDEMADILDQLTPASCEKIVLHSHFSLAERFRIGGLHLNHRNPIPPSGYSGPFSRSCHSIEEANESTGMDYVTLSPIFDSISKDGYKSAFNIDNLKALDSCQVTVIALGGITPGRTAILRDYNFGGYAMLGTIPWNGSVDDVRGFAISALNN